MPILAYAKQRTGKQMGSRALVADSKETWVCSYLSLALLIGVGAYALFGWWWVDSLAALVMLPVIVWQGLETLAEAREHIRSRQRLLADPVDSRGRRLPRTSSQPASCSNAAQAGSLRVQVDLAA